MARAKSVVWDFFTQTSNPKYAKCKMCDKNKSLGSTKKRDHESERGLLSHILSA